MRALFLLSWVHLACKLEILESDVVTSRQQMGIARSRPDLDVRGAVVDITLNLGLRHLIWRSSVETE